MRETIIGLVGLMFLFHMTDMSPLWLIPGYADWFVGIIIYNQVSLFVYGVTVIATFIFLIVYGLTEGFKKT